MQKQLRCNAEPLVNFNSKGGPAKGALNKRCGHFESKADGAQEPECIPNT